VNIYPFETKRIQKIESRILWLFTLFTLLHSIYFYHQIKIEKQAHQDALSTYRDDSLSLARNIKHLELWQHIQKNQKKLSQIFSLLVYWQAHFNDPLLTRSLLFTDKHFQLTFTCQNTCFTVLSTDLKKMPIALKLTHLQKEQGIWAFQFSGLLH
jgi:hypothetical protein